MNKYICECCGWHIDSRTMTCEYCGTKFKRDNDDVIRIETFRNPVKTFTACVDISDDDLASYDGKTIAQWAINSLVSKLSESLYDNMIVEDVHDIAYLKHRIRGTIKLVEPKESPRFSLPPFSVTTE